MFAWRMAFSELATTCDAFMCRSQYFHNRTRPTRFKEEGAHFAQVFLDALKLLLFQKNTSQVIMVSCPYLRTRSEDGAYRNFRQGGLMFKIHMLLGQEKKNQL
jgi:hypothetical protein